MRVLVTGGGGFLGRSIVDRLIARGDSVRSIQRSETPELAALGVECLRGDIAESTVVERAAADCDAVFHVAAKAGVWGRYEEFHRANVLGTENILKACRSQGISKLVYTSSPSVVFSGQDENGIDESAPYPTCFLTYYPQTKAIAERAVLAANDAKLSTVALRPHLIWGPGDNHLFPRLVRRAHEGKLRRVGDGKNLVDTTYIDNAADAHLLAESRLSPNSPVAGKAYFISNGEPMPIWDLINQLLACANEPPISRQISARSAYLIGGLLEFVYTVTGRRDEPPMTRFVARQLSTAHWFKLDAARNDFGYVPKVTISEGLQRLTESLGTAKRPN